MGQAEDKRVAVGFSVALSGQLITAALAMLAVEGAYLAYALGARDIGTLFFIAAVGSAIAFVVSIWIAGKGITAARNAGFDGNWDLNEGKAQFNGQALWLLAGLALAAAMFLLSGRSKDTEIEKRLVEAKRDAAAAKTAAAFAATDVRALRAEVNALSAKTHVHQPNDAVNSHCCCCICRDSEQYRSSSKRRAG